MKNLLVAALLCIVAVSCKINKPLYNWAGYDDAVYNYTKVNDKKQTEQLYKVYERLIKNSGGSRKVPPPGICADYGYLLIKNGDIARGKELLIKETTLYPESKIFVDKILKRINQ